MLPMQTWSHQIVCLCNGPILTITIPAMKVTESSITRYVANENLDIPKP